MLPADYFKKQMTSYKFNPTQMYQSHWIHFATSIFQYIEKAKVSATWQRLQRKVGSWGKHICISAVIVSGQIYYLVSEGQLTNKIIP